MSSHQGYLTIATGSEAFLNYAINLRLSCFYNDPQRPFALVTDKHLLRKLNELGWSHIFNKIILYEGKYASWATKLDLLDLSYFDQTFFIDADSLMIKYPVPAWGLLDEKHFAVQGAEHFEGLWYGQPQKKIMDEMGLSYLPKFNSGFLYFDKSDIARSVFETAQELYENQYDQLGFSYSHGLKADEPVFAVAMARHRIRPLPDHSNIMFTILGIDYWFGRVAKLSLSMSKRKVYFKKHGKPVSPIILHCCAGLRESWRYKMAARQLRKLVQMPSPDFQKHDNVQEIS